MVAINGSLEIDLTGQICSESHGNIMRTGTGGQLDFVIGSFWSKGGRAINLVPRQPWMISIEDRPLSLARSPGNRSPSLCTIHCDGVWGGRSDRTD